MPKRLLEITSLTLISLAALALGGLLAFRVQRGNFQIVSAIKAETGVKINPLKREVDFDSGKAEKLASFTGSSIALAKEKQAAPKAVEAASNISQAATNLADSDNDGLSDELENRYGSNPFSADTDGDGYLDGEEVKNGYSPTSPAGLGKSVVTAVSGQTDTDTDSDGLSNSDESKYGSNPNNPDTDADGYLDGVEVKNGYSPTMPVPKQTPKLTSQTGGASPVIKDNNELTELLKSTGYQASLPQVADAKIKVYANHNEYFDLVNAVASGAQSQITQAAASLSGGNLAGVKALADQFNEISGQLAAIPAPAELANDHKKLVAVFKGYSQTLNKLSSINSNSPTAQTDATQVLAEIALYDQEAKNIFAKFK